MLLVALLPLVALVNSEKRLNEDEEEELARRNVVHKENDFRAPDFDLSQLKVRGIRFENICSVEGAFLGDRRGARMSTGTPTPNCL